MSENDDQIEALNQAVVRTQAMYFALESLCLAITGALPNKPDVLARFLAHAESLDVRVLFDGEVPDDAQQEIALAHSKIAGLLRPLGAQL